MSDAGRLVVPRQQQRGHGVTNRLGVALIRTALLATAGLKRAGVVSPSAGRGAIFTLHHVRPAGTHEHGPNAHLSVTPAFLDLAIRTIKTAGLVPLALDALPERLADPTDRTRYCVFTVDDAYVDCPTYAAPVFRAHGVPYTLFVCSGFVERRTSMWWETAEALFNGRTEIEIDFGDGPERLACATPALRARAFARIAAAVTGPNEDAAIARLDAVARAAGVDPLALVEQDVMDAAALTALAEADPLAGFGAHSETHVNLHHATPERLEQEIGRSIAAVETWVGRRPKALAYPYGFRGAFGPREAAAVRAAGLDLAVTTRPGVIGATGAPDLYALPRISLNGLHQSRAAVEALVTGLPFRLVG
ncbi:polysaccharide deacetylase family protein [Methyloraptor flagellatus]|uniref:Chitooligosaccharide deacetylase n=1 Tax=Methyloraptor flagellatus TaxID=3162530 RepID=A0AAU7XDX9_9HYPH